MTQHSVIPESLLDLDAPADSPDEDVMLAAYEEASAAYKQARRVVYDLLPTGPVREERLSTEQKAALRRLDVAERRVTTLRDARRRGSPLRALRLA